MRVLITVPSLLATFGGPSDKALNLLRHLPSHAVDVELVGCGEAAGAIGLPVLARLHATPIPARVAPLIELATKADVIHVIGYRDPVGTLAAYRAQKGATPYVFEPAGMHRRRVRSPVLKSLFDVAIGKRVHKGAAAVIATSRLERDELVADGVDAELIRVRPNGVTIDDSSRPRSGMFRVSHNVPREVPLIISLGRISRKKRLDHLAQALRKLPGVWAAVVGPDDRDGGFDDLMRARSQLRLEDRLIVDAAGAWGDAKADAFAESDAFCLPSSTENFGTAALEAAIMGLPVVISDRCGGAEWLSDTSARIFRYGDIDGLADGLQTVLLDPSFKANSVRRAEELRRALDWHEIAAQQAAIYREVAVSTEA